jgi:NAD(P)-dependent dehydrogenase (short-subunit alcohol dehydrogenase family)
LNFANASAANGAVEAFIRAAAIEMEKGIRINAVSPTVIKNSPNISRISREIFP